MTALKGKVAGGKWTTAGTWEPSQVPGLADDCTLDAETGAIEVSAIAKGRSLDASAYPSGKTLNILKALSLGTTTANAGKYILKISAGCTVTFGEAGQISLQSTSSEEMELAVAKALACTEPFGLKSGSAANNKVKLAEKLELTSGDFQIVKGTLNTNNQELVVPRMIMGFGETANSGLKLGSSVVKLTGKSGTVWKTDALSGLTIEYGTSNIEITGTGTEQKAFEALTASGSPSTVTVAADNVVLQNATFNTLHLNNAGAATGTRLVTIGPLTVTTVDTNGKAGSLARLVSFESGTQATMKKASGTVTLDYVEFKDMKFEGGATWIAGPNSVDLGNNSGITFQNNISGMLM